MTLPLEYRAQLAPAAIPRRSIKRLFIDNNPFYLLSAACMLLGLMTLTNSLSFSPIPHYRLVMLIGTLNLYETVLIGLAIWLITRRKQTRDGEILLAIEALFIADGAMLSAEVFMVDPGLGAMINVVLLILAAGKLALILTALRLPVERVLPPILAQMLLVLFLPGVLKWSAQAHAGSLPALALYGAWWTTALLAPLTYCVWRFASPAEPWRHDRLTQPARRIAVTFSVMAGFSIFVHLCVSHWVYKVKFYPSELVPLTLGCAFTALLASRRAKDATPMRVMVLASILAIVESLPAPSPLTLQFGLEFTTLRFALFGAAAIFACAFAMQRRIGFAIAALGLLLLAALGPRMPDILDNLLTPWRWMAESSERLIPNTPGGWGIVSVGFAFVLLAAGAVVSIQKKPPAEPDIAERFSIALRESDLKRRNAS